jgi:hypothetical protein
MASYSSYRKIRQDSIVTNSIPDAAFQTGAGKNFNTIWIRGGLGFCSGGCCCLWTVPTGVYRVTFEAWGAGGNGNGACSCNRCHHYKGSGGGYYNSVTISTVPGCQYSVCAGGVFPCLSNECTGCNGCTSYVNGFNLSNFCAIGGTTACANTDWNTFCFSAFECCLGPVSNGGDFGMGNHPGAFSGSFACHCYSHNFCATGAPFLNMGNVTGELTECWIRCGCFAVPYATGGQSAMTTYCGSSCCGQGGTGGTGVVKITYV